VEEGPHEEEAGKEDIMIVFGSIALGVLFFLYLLAKGAIRFNMGPRWLRRLIIDEPR
jgi:hypothetical protein